MGTLGNVKIKVNGKFQANIQTNMDGDLLEDRLIKILNERPIVNGIPMYSEHCVINGGQDLTPVIIGVLKFRDSFIKAGLYYFVDEGYSANNYSYELNFQEWSDFKGYDLTLTNTYDGDEVYRVSNDYKTVSEQIAKYGTVKNY